MYAKAFHEAATDPNPNIKKVVLYGVKMINAAPRATTKDDAVFNFRFADMVQTLIGFLTPGEFENVFPITKDYNGNRYGCKDYFYTRDFIENLPDNPIGDVESVMNFLWEYHNWEISEFAVNVMGYVDDFRKLEGQPSMVEEFCAKNNIRMFTMCTDQKGKQFLLDRQTGKSFPVKKKKPRYLRMVN